MALVIKSTRKIVDPKTFKWKVLLYALSGTGKTTWLKTVPNLGVAACETGEGNGLLPLADSDVEYVEPTSYQDFQAICSGQVFKDKDAIAIDSLTDMAQTFIKDYALQMTAGGSARRQAGCPELQDYMVMGEVTRRLLRKLLDLDKHVIVTATMKFDKPNQDEAALVGGTTMIGPALPGQLFLGSTAMFDTVLCMRTRPVAKEVAPGKKVRVNERYFITEQYETGNGLYIAKSRNSVNNKALLDPEEVFDRDDGRGSFTFLLNKILKGYGEQAPVAA